MWQQKENLFSDRFVVPTWLKRATIYSPVSLLEENVHMAWTGFSSGLANQNQARALFNPRAEGSAAANDPSHLTCRKTVSSLCNWGNPCKPHQRVKCRTSKTDAGRHHGGILKTSSSSDLPGDFCTWHHSKRNLESCHLILLLLLAEMQWWMSTLRKDLCPYNCAIQFFCLMVPLLPPLASYWNEYILQKILSR